MSWMTAHEVASDAHLRQIKEYAEDWFCYWDGSFGMPKDGNVDFVFKIPLRVTASGVVTSGNAGAGFLATLNVQGGSPLQQLAEMLHNLAQELHDKECMCMSESEYDFLPFVAPLLGGVSNGELDSGAVLAALGAHAELQASASDCSLADIMSNNDDGGTLRQKVLALLGGDVLVFECGEGKLNPMPVFVLAHVHDALVGFLTAKVCT